MTTVTIKENGQEKTIEVRLPFEQVYDLLDFEFSGLVVKEKERTDNAG